MKVRGRWGRRERERESYDDRERWIRNERERKAINWHKREKFS